MLIYRFYLPLFFIFTLFFLNSLYALDFNYINTDETSSAVVCSKSGGTPDAYNQNTISATFDNNNHVFLLNKSWYKYDTQHNDNNIPYLNETNTNSTFYVTVIKSYSINENANTITLTYETTKCLCNYGNTDYGTCVDQVYPDSIGFDTSKTATEICSLDGDIPGATGVFLTNTYYSDSANIPSQQECTNYKGTEICRNGVSNPRQFIYVPSYNKKGEYYENYTSMGAILQNQDFGKMDKIEFECTCPPNYTKDKFGRCQKVDCNSPFFEYPEGQCTERYVCSDGAPYLNGSCDRSCESVGFITQPLYNSNNALDPVGSKCVQSFDCSIPQQSCIDNCGGLDNIATFACDSSLGVTQPCTCKSDTNNPDNPDNPDDPNTDNPSADMTETNSLLTQNNEKLDYLNQTVDEIDSLLLQSNENDLTRETQLNSIDGKLTDIDNSITGLNSAVNSLNDDLNTGLSGLGDGLDEVNEHLTNIENTNQNMSDFTDTLKDIEADTIQNDIGDNLSILDNVLNEYSTFRDNLTSQYETVVDLGESANNTINNGFTSIFSGHTSDKTECSQSFQLNIPYVEPMNISIDPCYFTSTLKVFFYPIFYLIFSFAVFSFAFSMFRGIL